MAKKNENQFFKRETCFDGSGHYVEEYGIHASKSISSKYLGGMPDFPRNLEKWNTRVSFLNLRYSTSFCKSDSSNTSWKSRAS